MANFYVSKTGSNTPPYDTWEKASTVIQNAINLASSGDTVWIRSGTYIENLTIGNGMTVRSETGIPSSVVIDGNQAGPCVNFTSINALLIGCTITNGKYDYGGGVYCVGLTGQNNKLYNCIIVGNFVDGGIPYGTGGVYGCYLYNCLVNYNQKNGVSYSNIYNSTVVKNDRNIYACYIYNTISYYKLDLDDVVISNFYSCGPGYSGTGSIDADPLFINSLNNFRLSINSPCIDVGYNYSWMTDPSDPRNKDLDGNSRVYNATVDMGAYESCYFEYSSSSSSYSSISSSSMSSFSSSSLSSSSRSSISSSSLSSFSSSSLSSFSSSSLSSSSSSSSSSPSSSSISSSSMSSSSFSSFSSLSSKSSSKIFSSQSSSISQTPNITDYIYKDWRVSREDTHSTEVHYELYGYEDIILQTPILHCNTYYENNYFLFDATGTGKHFTGFPSTGLNYPPLNSLVRYYLNKYRLKRFFITQNDKIYHISVNSNYINNTYNLNNIDIINISLNTVNGDIWILGDNYTAYCIANANFQNPVTSVFLSNNTMFIKVDGTRNTLWQIETNKLILKTYNGIEIFSVDLPVTITKVVNCLILPNTGEIFILALSDDIPSGTIIISYLKNRSGGMADLLYNTDYNEDISYWDINKILTVNGDQTIKIYNNGVITTLFYLSALNINPNLITSIYGKDIYILNKSQATLYKIDYKTGNLIWSLNLSSNIINPLKIKCNFDANCIWVVSNTSCLLVIDKGNTAYIENFLTLPTNSSIDAEMEEHLQLSHIWLKYENVLDFSSSSSISSSSQSSSSPSSSSKSSISSSSKSSVSSSSKSSISSISSSEKERFISTWDTRNLTTGSSGYNQIRLPLIPTGTYDFIVWWGDGTSDHITVWNQSARTHTYSTPGVKTIIINGIIKGWSHGSFGDERKILNISQWGCLSLGPSSYQFVNCQNLDITATDVPNLQDTTSFAGIFKECSNLIFNSSINNWDTSNITDLWAAFEGAVLFDQDISNWDVSNVTEMSETFAGAVKFNQNIGGWDVSNVIRMSSTFSGAISFNQNLGNWNISKVTLMQYMFWNVPMSTVNYDALLIGWASLPSVQPNVLFGANLCRYTKPPSAAATARAILTSPPNNWVIWDGGPTP